MAELGVVTTVERDPDASVSFGKRVGDGTTAAVERLNQVGTARELDAMLRDVDRALQKLEDGTYGICDRCGRLIPEERLEARPWSVLCVEDAALRS
jgi:DnaK suppressor protein